MFPETRQGEWSKTITIQGYSEVNKAFTHIYEINETITSDTQYDPSFNPNKRANVIYQSDGVVQMRGYIRLIEINKILETSEIQYQCQIINNVSDFFADISGKSPCNNKGTCKKIVGSKYYRWGRSNTFCKGYWICTRFN